MSDEERVPVRCPIMFFSGPIRTAVAGTVGIAAGSGVGEILVVGFHFSVWTSGHFRCSSYYYLFGSADFSMDPGSLD